MRPAGDEPLFALSGVRVTGAGGERVLDGLTAEIPAGGVTVVAGPSGSGKTTLLRLCNRLEAPDEGRVAFRGRDVAELDPLALRRRVGMVFQRPTAFGGTVRDNLLVADPGATPEACRAALRRAGLPAGFLDRPAADLSGGEAQRMCVARALMAGPEVLLMDEPASALDPAAAAGLERLARDLAASGVPVVWVTHDLAQLGRIADHVLVLQDGRVAEADAARAYLAGAEVAGG